MILEKRNEAVEKLILKIVNKTDEFAVAVPDAVRKDPPELDCKTVSIVLEDGSEILVLAETNPRKSASVLMDAPNLHSLCTSAQKYKVAVKSPKKRRRSKTIDLDQNWITKNSSRGTISAMCQYSDGHKLRKVVKIEDGAEWTQESVNAAFAEMESFMKKHHCVESGGQLVNAFDHGLGIFAEQGIGDTESEQS